MVSDVGFDELHDFAARLGIPRRRFQGDHYDLHPALRARAVALGAAEVTTSELVQRMAGPRGDRARRRRMRRARDASVTPGAAASSIARSPDRHGRLQGRLRAHRGGEAVAGEAAGAEAGGEGA
jgi:uncharacterized protein DUF4031